MMGAGRVNAILSVVGIAVFAVLLVWALLQMSRKRSAGQNLDPMGLEPVGDTSGPGRPLPPEVFPDFGSVLRQVVVPRLEANPGWERLDGAYGVRGRTVARFDRDGTLYALNGDSEMAALMAALEWIGRNPGGDPLEVLPTKKGAGRLTLRPEISGNRESVKIETA